MTRAELRAAREQLGLSQAAMAKRIGRSLRQYKAYELGEYPIPLVVVRAVEGLRAENPTGNDQHKETAT